MAAKTEKMRFWIVAHSKWCYVGKVPKLFFENFTKKIIIFLGLFVGKVPKSSVFNRDCLETRKIQNRKNYGNQKKKVKYKNRVFAASKKVCFG